MAWSDITGWYGFEHTYRRAVDAAQDGDVFVELGVAFGRSVAHLARMCIDNGKKVKIYAIDPWTDDNWAATEEDDPCKVWPSWGGEDAEKVKRIGGPYSAFLDSMRTHAPEELEYIKPLRLYSYEAAKLFAPGSLKLCMIDANHFYKPVLEDILTWMPKVRPDGILAGDDYSDADFPGVVKAVKEVFGPDGYQIEGSYRTTWVKK